MTAQDVIDQLELEPLRGEGGYYKRIWYSSEIVPAPKGGKAREYRQSSAIYYLMNQGKKESSILHSLAADEQWHFYQGDPVELHLFHPNGVYENIRLGNDLIQGERPFHLVPRGTIMGARMFGHGVWALLGNSLAPSYEPEDYQLPSLSDMIRRWPRQKEIIRALGSE